MTVHGYLATLHKYIMVYSQIDLIFSVSLNHMGKFKKNAHRT